MWHQESKSRSSERPAASRWPGTYCPPLVRHVHSLVSTAHVAQASVPTMCGKRRCHSASSAYTSSAFGTGLAHRQQARRSGGRALRDVVRVVITTGLSVGGAGKADAGEGPLHFAADRRQFSESVLTAVP